jgi:nucleoside-diphosphate-sugar epimerase
MRILVTGAAGFIGSALCKKLQLSGHDITAIDSFSDYLQDFDNYPKRRRYTKRYSKK